MPKKINIPKMKIYRKKRLSEGETEFVAIFENVLAENGYVEYYAEFELKIAEDSNFGKDYYCFSEYSRGKYKGMLSGLDEVDVVLLKKLICTSIYEILNNGTLYIKRNLNKKKKNFKWHLNINRQLKLALRRYKYEV